MKNIIPFFKGIITIIIVAAAEEEAKVVALVVIVVEVVVLAVVVVLVVAVVVEEEEEKEEQQQEHEEIISKLYVRNKGNKDINYWISFMFLPDLFALVASLRMLFTLTLATPSVSSTAISGINFRSPYFRLKTRDLRDLMASAVLVMPYS